MIRVTLEALKRNRFAAHYAGDAAEARGLVLELVPSEATVGIGDSATLRQLNVLPQLLARGNRVVNPFDRDLSSDPNRAAERQLAWSQVNGTAVFLTGTNAVTADGKLVNTDCAGNRVAGMLYGHAKVVLVVGRNKIVKDLNEALERVKKVLAPAHALAKKMPTPCAETSVCSDCSAPYRLCNVTVIMEKKPFRADMTVILVDEDLGLGWDSAWSRERIERIRKAYQRETWPFPVRRDKPG